MMPFLTSDGEIDEVIKYSLGNDLLDMKPSQEHVVENHDRKTIDDVDSATCVIDLEKVKKQFEIWQDSFKGTSVHKFAIKTIICHYSQKQFCKWF